MEDALDAIIDYRGKTPKKSETGIPTLSAKSVKNNRIDYAECYYISQEEYTRFMVRGFPKIGDILLTTEAPMGVAARLDRDDVAIAQRLLTLRGKKDVLDNDFLLYYLQSPVGQALLKSRETGTTVTGIKQAEFRKIEITVPEYTNQKRIAAILKSLDDKIAVNQRINDNLQQQAQAVYTEWCSRCTEQVEIGEVAENILDYTPNLHLKVVLVNSSEVTEGHFDHHNLSENANLKGHFKKRFQKYDVLYSEIRPKNKHYAYVLFDANKYIASTRLMVIRAKRGIITPSLLYQHLSSQRVCDEFASTTETRSGTFPQGCYADLSKITIPYKPIDQQTEITGFLDSVYLTIEHNDSENRGLAELRDTILPRLMSGEIDVSEVEI